MIITMTNPPTTDAAEGSPSPPPSPPMEEAEWLERTGLQPGLGSKLAFSIVTGGDVFARSKQQKLQKYEELFHLLWHRPEECVEELVKWRFPGLNLNLMQLAVVCENYLAVNQLKRKNFSESEQCEGKTVYENHPLYLAYSHGYCKIIDLLSEGDGCHFEEVAAVTVAANSGSLTTPDVPAVRLPIPLQGSCIHLAILNQHTSLVERLLPDYFAYLGRSEGISALGIECLWLVLGFIYRSRKSAAVPLQDLLFRSKRAAMNENLFLVCCQLFHAGSKEMTESCTLTCSILSRILDAAVSNDRLDLLPVAAGYLTHGQLRLVIGFLEDDTDPSSRARPACPHQRSGPVFACFRLFAARKSAVPFFQQELRFRTLQHHAVLTILRSVRGDPRQARTLENLPEPLLSKFHVPFQDLHRQLAKASH